MKSEANPLKQRIWYSGVIASHMPLWALNPDNPYGYYICSVGLSPPPRLLGIQGIGQEQQGWGWVLGITAVVYNPVIRVHLNREIWSVVNLITIGVAVASIFAINFSEEKRGSVTEPDAESAL